MPGRQFTAGNGYRYGFNGKENDNEVKGHGGQQDYGFRIYDTRVGRFLSIDPFTQSYPWYTPYQFAGNMPIWAIDLDGGEEKKITESTLTEASTRNVNRILSEYHVKEQIFKGIYAAIDKKIPSKTEVRRNHASARYNGEESIIKGVVFSYIKVDLENNIAYVFDPETKEPAFIYKIGKEIFSFATNEALPVAATTAGAGTYAMGNLLVRVTNNAESYKTNFYKKYFPDKYKAASKVNSVVTGNYGRLLKFGGILMKGVGKLLNGAGTIGMFIDVIDTSPGPMSDDQLKEFTNNAMKEYLLNATSTINTQSTNSDNQQKKLANQIDGDK